MDDLILRGLEGELTPAEERTLAEWRAASPANEDRSLKLARLHSLLVNHGREAARRRPRAGEIVARSASRRLARPWRRLRWLIPLAAGFGLGLGIYRLAAPPATAAAVAAGFDEIATGPGETATVRLVDGSVVRLAPGSRLTVKDLAQTREVSLQGTAFFAIAKRQGKSFVVRTPSGIATVLGTRFELQASASETRVVVFEGRVAVEDQRHRVQVGPDEMTFVGSGAAPTVSKVAARELVTWLGKVLLFQDTPLADVAREIEDRYQVQVVVTDSALARLLVSATFPEQSVERVVSVVCQIVDAECSIGGRVVTISAR